MRERPLDGILSLTIDYERDELRVVTDDGRVGIQAGAMSGPEGPIDFRTVIFRPAEMTLEMVVPWGNRLEIEVFAHDDQSLRKSGRPVVYLDQNKWVQIALATYRPEGVRPLSELAPTLRIIDLARSRRVLLPISSGHWIETGPLWGRQRAHVASLMVGLSRGWVMRDPLRVAASEITRLFGNEPASGVEDAGAVFTLDAGALFAEPVPKYVPRDPALPPETVKLIDSLSSVQAVLAVLLENERTQDPVGVERARQWAAVHHAFAEQLARRRLSGQDRRRQTLNAFISDLGHGLTDIARAHGLGSTALRTWIDERADRDLRQLPCVGRRREITHARLSNAGDRWHEHDLVDMLYLPCAAEYADYVVCEKKMAHYLQRTGRNRPGVGTVVTSLADLLRVLEPQIRS